MRGVADFTGIGGSLRVESVAGLPWNRWQLCYGIGGRLRLEYAVKVRGWVKDPHSGGVKIPERIRERVKTRILKHAETHHAGKYTRIDIRFKGFFCYIDAYQEPYIPDDYDRMVLK